MVVRVRGSEGECDRVLTAIMDKVLEVKTRCCDSLEMRVYCIHPHDLSSEESIPELKECRLFDCAEMFSALRRKGEEISAGHVLPNSKLETLSYWGELVLGP